MKSRLAMLALSPFTKDRFCEVLVVFVVTFFPIFYNLGEAPIRIWDEAIYAVNSLEMSFNKNFFVYHVNGEPNLYNVKPPFVLWLQTLMIWIFGANEWAIRLPSALAAFCTCLVVFLFAKRNLNTTVAFISVIILITVPGYIKPHVSRTGDLDSVLVFFITFYTLIFFELLLKKPSKQNTYWLLIGSSVFLAFFSKSVAGLIPILGLFLGTIVTGNAKEILLKKQVYIVAVCVVLACIGYYLFREALRPGYLELVIFSEYQRFIDNIMPWHEQPYSFYLNNIINETFYPYAFLLPLTLFGIISEKKSVQTFSVLAWGFTISYLLVISYPTVKLPWYDAPLFPIMSLMLATFLHQLFLFLEERAKILKWGVMSVVIVVLAFQYFLVIENNKKNTPIDFLEYDGFAIRELSKLEPDIKNYKVLLTTSHPAHNDVVNFYIRSLNYTNKGFNLKLIKDPTHVSLGDTILCSQEENINVIKQSFSTEFIKEISPSKLFVIKEIQ